MDHRIPDTRPESRPTPAAGSVGPQKQPNSLRAVVAQHNQIIAEYCENSVVLRNIKELSKNIRKAEEEIKASEDAKSLSELFLEST